MKTKVQIQTQQGFYVAKSTPLWPPPLARIRKKGGLSAIFCRLPWDQVGCDETSHPVSSPCNSFRFYHFGWSPSNRFRQVYGKTEFMDFVRFSRGRLPPEPPKVEAEVVDTEATKPPEEAAKEVPQKWEWWILMDLRFGWTESGNGMNSTFYIEMNYGWVWFDWSGGWILELV